MEKTRCAWVPLNDDIYVAYHDNEWGKPVHDDHVLFEMLILEGMQAGLNWITILKKRDNFREAFDNFDIDKIAAYDDAKLAQLMQNQGIIRNKLKISSAVKNANAFKNIQNEFGSFDKYLWGFVENGIPVKSIRDSSVDVPARNELSDEISKDLVKRGFKFVGTTIICAYLHAVGVLDGHIPGCFLASDK